MLYQKMLENITSPPTALDKWPLESRILLDLIEQIYRITNHSKILDTQFRINNRFYHTTKQLCICKKEASAGCPSCQLEDTLAHYFVECDII